MKVFLSWSGDRSKAVAEELGAWLARVIQAVEPWISSGMEKGVRWQGEVADRLEEAKIGIVCLTSSNLTAPWILFEAGALSKTQGSYVCTFLLDISPADIEPPLGQFQHTVFAREDVLKLVRTINEAVKAAGDRFLSDENTLAVFNTFWPQLEGGLNRIKGFEEAKSTPRPERELLEEMLEILRNQEQRVRKDEEKETFEYWSKFLLPKKPRPAADAYADILDYLAREQATKATKTPPIATEPGIGPAGEPLVDK